MTTQVVVTGMGMTTPVGGDVATSWASVLAGTSGISVIDEAWVADQPAKIAGRMAVNPAEVLDRVEARRMDRSQQAALVAAREAWAQAGAPEVDPERLGAVVASGIGGVTSLLDSYDILLERGPSRISPHMVTMIMPNGPAAIVGLEVGAQAGIHTPVSACSSGAEAISFAARMIQTGRADVVIAGGTEAVIHPITMAGFAAMRALSTRNDDPTTASRPYDTGRDGFVMGEGSARAMSFALEDAGLTTADVVHVNAHATSTPQGDVAEATAIRRALGADTDHAVVTATKSMTGHLLGGAGAIESIFTILALRDRLVPPTANLVDLDPEVTLDVAVGEPRPLPAGDIAAINNSFGFGGHEVAVAFRSV